MSGIAGIIRFDGGPVEAGQIQQMTDAMAHRGPDGIYHHHGPSVALGYCQLCSTSEALEEVQPALSADKQLMLVMDGRVDNFENLRGELTARGARLRNRSDAELVLAAYEIWGRDCLQHIDGDFAFVIWDERRQAAFCARDHNGNKPFCYHWDGKILTFASQVSAILAMPWVKREQNTGMLAEYLANSWHSRSDTLWSGISRLVAAHSMDVTGKGVRTVQHWQPELGQDLPCKSDGEYAEYYRCLITEAVRRSTRSHKPVAFEVSGGLDSSSLFCIFVHLRHQSALNASDIKAYTLKLAGFPDQDERNYAHAAASTTGVPLREVGATHRDMQWFREVAEQTGEFPGYPNGTMSVGLRQQARDAGCRVLITGVGGDEWLGLPWRYGYYRNAIANLELGRLGRMISYDKTTMGGMKAAWLALRHGLVPMLPEPIKKALRGKPAGQQVADWLDPAMLEELASRKSAEPFGADVGRKHRYQYRLLYEAYSALARELEERSIAHQQLDLRSPFFSRDIIQFAFCADEWMLSRGNVNRWLHRHALAGIVPEVILQRDWKSDFMGVFHQHLAALPDGLTDDIANRRRGWVVPEAISALRNKEQDGTDEGWEGWLLWTLFGCDAVCANGGEGGTQTSDD